MKNKLDLKDIHVGYLYPDGHFVGYYEKTQYVKKQRIVSKWYEAHESLNIKVYVPNARGRIIFHNQGSMFILKHPDLLEITMQTADVSHGSENSKLMGLPIGHVKFRFKGNSPYNTWFIPNCPTVISCDPYYQDDNSEVWDDIKNKHRWGYDDTPLFCYAKGEKNAS